MTASAFTVPDGGPQDSTGGAKVLPWPRGSLQDGDARAAWISEAEQHARATVLVPADHPARAWAPEVASEVEAAGLLLYKAAYAAATQAMTEARAAVDLPKAERAEQWRKELGRIKRGPKYGTPKPDRWLILADAIRSAHRWLPDGALDDGHMRALDRLAEVAAERKATLDRAQADALAVAVAAEVERRSAPGAWEAELQQRGEQQQAAQDAKRHQARARAMLVPSPDDPMAVARHIEPEWTRDGVLTLRRWRGEWWRWNGAYWVAGTDEEMRSSLYQRMEHAMYLFVDGRSGIESKRRWAPTGAKVKNLAEAAAAVTALSSSVEAPGWTDGQAARGVLIPCRNGLLDLETRRLIPPTPRYFNQSAAPFDYNPRAPKPKRWLGFLDSVWHDDPGAVDLLQEIFGYIISGSRHLEKIPYLVGPKRSGKGTIALVLRLLVGEAHTAGPTLAGLASNFGIAPLIGKSLALIPDARLPRDGIPQLVENLLTISSGDSITVDRKHRDAWNGVITARIVMMSNRLLPMPDTAEALVGRYLMLRMTESFYGREDTTLKADLPSEIPGIFNWSLVGLDRLMKRGRFLEPESSAEAVELLSRASSPTKAFLGDRCILDPTAVTSTEALWNAWLAWCRAEGRDHVGTKETFGRDLFDAEPGKIRKCKPRVDGSRVPSYEGVRLDL